MQLELIIKGELIETVDIPYHPKDQPTFSQREAMVMDYRNYLKRKYYLDIMITDDWSIELIVSSRLNLLTEDYSDDEVYREAIERLKATG